MPRLAPLVLALVSVLPLVSAGGDLSFSRSDDACDALNSSFLPCDAHLSHAGTAGSTAPCSLDALGHRICVLSVDVSASATGHVMVPGAQDLAVTAFWHPCCVSGPAEPALATICAVRSDADALSCSGHADLAIDFGPPQPGGPSVYSPAYNWRDVYIDASLTHEGLPYTFEGPSAKTSTHLYVRLGPGADAAASVSFI